jgi:signal transduction histidine kinase/DNA-binding NarL/FixJ family response regulator
MLIAGTQLHVVTFIFVCIEIIIFFYLIIYRLSRPDDDKTSLNIILITLLLIYNISGGLLPDPTLPGSIFAQEIIAYGTGFITPCYFPFYVYKVFGLYKMKYHVYRGVFFFLFIPYLLFVFVYATTGELNVAKLVLAIPVLYALFIIRSLIISVRDKYGHLNKQNRKEANLLFLSIVPWIGLPLVSYFDLNQATEATITNLGFLLLLVLQVNDQVSQLKIEHEQLLGWNSKLHDEVDKRTKELEKIIEQRTYFFANLTHETKTPLTLINNYLNEYINTKGSCEELMLVKRSITKLTSDITSFFDLERFNKKIPFYNHEQVCDFSEIICDDIKLFKKYAQNKSVVIYEDIASPVYIKADPAAVSRIANNLIENAIKFTKDNGIVEVSLECNNDKIHFSVHDYGIGISAEMHHKIFEPYYQACNEKKNNQGMGLGLPIVKNIVEALSGSIQIESEPSKKEGTTFTVILPAYQVPNKHCAKRKKISDTIALSKAETIVERQYDESLATILIVEDNINMSNYLVKKLMVKYNVYAAYNGNEALKKIKNLPVLPDLIITDIMMDKMDGYHFADIISKNPLYNHIPFIFLTAKSTLQDKIKALKIGALDFMQKPFLIDELIQKTDTILRIVIRQKTLFFKTAFKSLSQKELNMNGADLFNRNCEYFHLSSREINISKLICQGYKYKEIADQLFISERTVTTHVQNIFEKVNVKSKIELTKELQLTDHFSKELDYLK